MLQAQRKLKEGSHTEAVSLLENVYTLLPHRAPQLIPSTKLISQKLDLCQVPEQTHQYSETHTDTKKLKLHFLPCPNLHEHNDVCVKVIRDVLNVSEMTLRSPAPSSVGKYRALRCSIEAVPCSSSEFQDVTALLQDRWGYHFSKALMFSRERICSDAVLCVFLLQQGDDQAGSACPQGSGASDVSE